MGLWDSWTLESWEFGTFRILVCFLTCRLFDFGLDFEIVRLFGLSELSIVLTLGLFDTFILGLGIFENSARKKAILDN